MKQILLTEEQARFIERSSELVELRDPQGKVLVRVDPADAKAMASHAQRRQSDATKPGIPGEKVQAYLQRLQAEWVSGGPFAKARADQIFAEMHVREE